MPSSDDTLAKRIRSTANRFPKNIAQLSKNEQEAFEPTTFQDFFREVKTIASGLRKLGVRRGDHVGLISDNRKEWILADLALLCLGAVDVPRGSDSTPDELRYILGHADCKISFVENQAIIEKIASRKKELPDLGLLISFDTVDDTGGGLKTMQFSELIESTFDDEEDHE